MSAGAGTCTLAITHTLTRTTQHKHVRSTGFFGFFPPTKPLTASRPFERSFPPCLPPAKLPAIFASSASGFASS